MRPRRKQSSKKDAIDHIHALFTEAEECMIEHPDRSTRYVEQARQIVSKFKVRVPPPWRRRFCRKCNAFLVPGRNCRVRTTAGKISMTCTACSHVMRFGMTREQEDRRQKAK